MPTDAMTNEATMSRRQVLVAFGGLLLVMLLASLDQTIVATALPTMAGDLGQVGHVSWVVTAFLLASTASTLIWGKVGDMYGRKRTLIVAIVVFLLTSAACGLAQGMSQLVAFRALQGVGAGGLMTMSMAMVGDIIAPRERGRYQGYIQAVFVLASVGGPLLGGVFVDYLSWRWVFYVNLPLGLAALAVIAIVLRTPVSRVPHRVDYAGAVLLVGGVSSLLLITVWGGEEYAWGSAPIVGLAVLSVGALAGFVWWERRAEEPILPLKLLTNPVIAVVSASLFLATCCFLTATVFLPVFLQIVRGVSATYSGLLLLPMLIAVTLSSTLSGRVITRTGRYKAFPVAGMAIVAVALFLFSSMDGDSAPWIPALYMVIFGTGFGFIYQVLTLAVQNAAGYENLGTATATANFFRGLGGSVGVAVFGTVFAAGIGRWLPRTLPGSKAGIDPASVLASPEQIQRLDAVVRSGVAEAVALSLRWVFLGAIPVALLGLIVLLFLREVPLRGREQQEQANRTSANPSPTVAERSEGARH